MGFWDRLKGDLFGREQRSKTFDPYEQDRPTKMAALSGAMGDYDKMMSTPGGAIPQAYRDQILGEVDRDVRNRYQGAGQSGFVGDRVSRAKNDMRIKMLDTELGQLNKQRDYMGNLISMNQPTQNVEFPGQTGVAQQVGGQLIGQAASGGMRAGMDALFGKEDDEEMFNKFARMFGTGGNATQGQG